VDPTRMLTGMSATALNSCLTSLLLHDPVFLFPLPCSDWPAAGRPLFLPGLRVDFLRGEPGELEDRFFGARDLALSGGGGDGLYVDPGGDGLDDGDAGSVFGVAAADMAGPEADASGEAIPVGAGERRYFSNARSGWCSCCPTSNVQTGQKEGKESDQIRPGVMESHVKSAVGSWSPGNKSSRLPRSRRRHRHPLSPLARRASPHHEL